MEGFRHAVDKYKYRAIKKRMSKRDEESGIDGCYNITNHDMHTLAPHILLYIDVTQYPCKLFHLDRKFQECLIMFVVTHQGIRTHNVHHTCM